MFTKTMTFDNLDGEEVQQTFYFNFTKKEMAELVEFGQIQKFAKPGESRLPLEDQLKLLSTTPEESGLTEAENTRQAYNIFQDLLLDAYGVKGADKVSFEKSHELRNYWSNHLAFVELIFEFLANPDQANEFIERCLPPKLVAQAKKQMQTEAGGKLTSGTIAEMSQEAARRQADPATRIEPGIEAARAALGENPEIEKLAGVVGQEAPVPVAPAKSELTEEDILTMPLEEFKALTPRDIPQELLGIAWARSASGK